MRSELFLRLQRILEVEQSLQEVAESLGGGTRVQLLEELLEEECEKRSGE